MWKCQFDRDILPYHPECKQHIIVKGGNLNTHDALYGGLTESMVLHYKIAQGETIQYYDVMSLYHYVFKYFKYPLDHHKIYVGYACRDKQVMLSIEGLIKCKSYLPVDSTTPSCHSAAIKNLILSVQNVRIRVQFFGGMRARNGRGANPEWHADSRRDSAGYS